VIWRLLAALALLTALAIAEWLLAGGAGALLRGERRHELSLAPGALAHALVGVPRAVHLALPSSWTAFAAAVGTVALALLVCVPGLRVRARRRRRYVRLRIEPYRTDNAGAEALVAMFATLHKRLLAPWRHRVLEGQPSLALEISYEPSSRTGSRAASAPNAGATPRTPRAYLTLSCPLGAERIIEAALRGAYPNCRLVRLEAPLNPPAAMVRLKKRSLFIARAKVLDRFEQERCPPTNRLLTVMGACDAPALVQLSLTPAPVLLERAAAHLFRRRERELSRAGRGLAATSESSLLAHAELHGGLEMQFRPLFYAELRVLAPSRAACERIASELRAEGAENSLVERGATVRDGWLGLYARRVSRGEGNPLPSFQRNVFAPPELAALWQLPSSDFTGVPLQRCALPLAPAPPAIYRPSRGPGILRDAHGPVSIHPEMRRQNTAVPGTVEQGKSSFLVATVAEDLLRERCAVIVLDPKGDAADAAVSLVPEERMCTLLDLANPTCGFNPLAVDAPGDVIADYVVAALKNLFTDADIRASSDRYLRNAIIAVLAYDGGASLWDAARLLSVGEDGYAYRRAVGARVRALPELKEIAEFFTAELSAQLADARSTTTAKLDAPVNKLARLLNSGSIKRVLLNEALRIDLDSTISGGEVLVVKGALGAMGAGNTSVVMQLLVGMLDAALARQQDLVPASERVAVALKIDEAPLVLNRGFAETMALKRSAGLETVACWQADAQWSDPVVRDQLDALFAHRVYFATASVPDARAAASLAMGEFSDTVRPGIPRLATLGHPDVRLHLPKHHAVACLATPEGRQPAFFAQTIPLRVDRRRLALHASRQQARGARRLQDLRQPHWQRRERRTYTAAELPEPVQDAGARQMSGAGERSTGSDAPRLLAVRRAHVEHAPLPTAVAESYAELVELDRAQSVRAARVQGSTRGLDVDAVDVEILLLVAAFEQVLSSQLHRRVHAGRSPTTTQRRLKRLADSGLLERVQFHRRDGGGVPMCCAITRAGRELIAAERRPLDAAALEPVEQPRSLVSGRTGGRARRRIHVAGWALALERAINARCALHGAGEAALSPPAHTIAGQRRPIGPRELRLPEGRVIHDFVHTHPDGERVETERFETVRPDAVVSSAGVDVLIEFDDRLPPGRAVAKLERYDHFLGGWSLHTRRYGRRREALPLVVFVCRDRARARELARRCDTVLCACRAYPGEYPFDWDYPGRELIVFAGERDVHEGSLCAYAVPGLPPAARVLAAGGDPRAGQARAEACQLLAAAAAGTPAYGLCVLPG
jgi:hypothetical protein